MSEYKLYYFDGRGIGEGIRLLFNYVGQPFEDIRFNMENWGENKSKFQYEKVPVLELKDGRQLAQHAAIARYLADKFGLSGKDEWEKAKVNEVLDFHKDVLQELNPYIYVKAGFRQGNADELFKSTFAPGVKKYFPIYGKLLANSKSGFLAPSGVTFIDFIIADSLFTMKKLEPKLLAEYPDIVKYIDRVYGLKQLAKYMGSRKE